MRSEPILLIVFASFLSAVACNADHERTSIGFQGVLVFVCVGVVLVILIYVCIRISTLPSPLFQ